MRLEMVNIEFPSLNEKGKVAVVAGASHGIGRTLALGLADAGADLVMASRTESDLKSLADETRVLGRKAIVQGVDLIRADDIRAAADAAANEFGRIAILVNNAGININKSALETTEENRDLAMAANLKSYFFTSQIFGRMMIDRGKEGMETLLGF